MDEDLGGLIGIIILLGIVAVIIYCIVILAGILISVAGWRNGDCQLWKVF